MKKSLKDASLASLGLVKINTFYSSTQSKNAGWEMPRKDEKKKLEKYLLLQRGELAGSGLNRGRDGNCCLA